jgi:hypothetical protein
MTEIEFDDDMTAEDRAEWLEQYETQEAATAEYSDLLDYSREYD